MALLPILSWPDTALSTPCVSVGDEDLGALITDMFETMYAAPGRGLAAPQVGVLKRFFVMDATWKEGVGSPLVMINPEILSLGPVQELGDEGCLSIPGVVTPVLRPTTVHLRWQDQHGAQQEGAFDGFAARCIQHEYDHLEGLVTFDRLAAEDRGRAEAEFSRFQETAP